MNSKDKIKLLKEYLVLQDELKLMDEHISEFRSTYSLPGMGFESGGHTNTKRDLSDYMVKYEKLLNRYYKKKYKLVEINTQIFDAIDKLENASERIVIHMRFIQGKGMDDVQDALHVERAQAYRIYNAAIKKIEL